MLITPFGEIKILVDKNEVPYSVQKGAINDKLYPNLLGRYQISITFVPDGNEHTIACIFEPNCTYERCTESGERLECQSFYSDRKYKMSIGIECEAGYINGIRVSEEYDYDAEYLINGMSYLILSNTKTERYVFGIAWMDNIDYKDTVDSNNNKEVQTWLGADPTLPL